MDGEGCDYLEGAMSIRIASVGELLVEFVATSKDGHHLVVGNYSGPFPSGAPGIFIDQAARCGGRAIFVGAVVDDAFGKVILRRLREDGVDDSLIAIHPGIPTGSAFVSYNADGSRDFVFNIQHSAAARFQTGPAVLERLVEFGLDVIHVSGSALSSGAMARDIFLLCQSLHARGVRVSFDPNLRKELMGDPDYLSVVRDLLAISTYVLPSDDDADVLFPGKAIEEFASGLFGLGVECVVLKRGEKGASGMRRDGQRVDVAAHAVAVADPTGAGDCFCGTFVTLFAGGMELGDALEYANAAGALAVTKVGPMEGNATFGQIRAFLGRDA